MFRLAHISDLHYFNSMRVPVGRLLNKRISGYVNLVLHRRFQHSPRILGLLMESLKGQGADHLVVTGDLTNLSLGHEFAAVRGIFLEAGFSADDISVIPGNHDRYTRGSEASSRFEGYLSPFMRSDIDLGPVRFPFVRLRDGVAIIGLNSALSLPPLLARGEIGLEQLTRLEVLMSHPLLGGRFPVLLLHHPPYRHPGRQLHILEGLQDYHRFLDAVPSRSALLLHGHLHRNVLRRIEEGGKRFLVSGVSSSSYRFRGFGSEAVSSYTLYEMDAGGVEEISGSGVLYILGLACCHSGCIRVAGLSPP